MLRRTKWDNRCCNHKQRVSRSDNRGSRAWCPVRYECLLPITRSRNSVVVLCQFMLHKHSFWPDTVAVCPIAICERLGRHLDHKKPDPLQRNHHQCQSHGQYKIQLGFWSPRLNDYNVFCRSLREKGLDMPLMVYSHGKKFSYLPLSTFPIHTCESRANIKQKFDVRTTLIWKDESYSPRFLKPVSGACETLYWCSFSDVPFQTKAVRSETKVMIICCDGDRETTLFFKKKDSNSLSRESRQIRVVLLINIP